MANQGKNALFHNENLNKAFPFVPQWENVVDL